MDEEALVEAVRGFPSLWQPSSKSYKDVIAKENAWKLVATQVGEGATPVECGKRWRAIRDRFVRELKKVKAKKSGTAGPPYVPAWSLFDALTFLTDTVKHRSTLSNFTPPTIVLDDGEEDQDESTEMASVSQPPSRESLSPEPSRSIGSMTSSSSVQPASKKRKTSRGGDDVDDIIIKSLKGIEERRQEKRSRQVEDEAELFGRLVASTLQRLSGRQQASAKLKIQQLLMDIEFPDESYFPQDSDAYSANYQ